MSDWPTRPVALNHLEAMGLLMALYAEDDGLSQPQIDAKDKLEVVLSKLLDDLGRPR